MTAYCTLPQEFESSVATAELQTEYIEMQQENLKYILISVEMTWFFRHVESILLLKISH